MLEKLSREKMIRSEENPGFFATAASLPMDWIRLPVYLRSFSSVYCRARLPPKARRPMTARTKNIPRQEVRPSSTAPKRGGSCGRYENHGGDPGQDNFSIAALVDILYHGGGHGRGGAASHSLKRAK